MCEWTNFIWYVIMCAKDRTAALPVDLRTKNPGKSLSDMDTKVITIEALDGAFSPREEQALQSAGAVLRQGGLVAFPTETVYGLGGDALNPASSRKIYAAKGRPSDNPLIVHIARMEDLSPIVKEVTAEARQIAEAFWPGPLTMILPKADKVPYETTGGLETVAVRMPSHPVAQKLILYGGGYVAAPSANLSGRPSPTTAKYVIEDMDGRIDMILDGGEGDIGLESTIVDLTVSPPQILRPGYITQDMLTQVLGQVSVDRTILEADSGQAPRAPGMKYRHYAPQGELTIISGPGEQVTAYINTRAAEDRAAGHRVGVIGTDEALAQYRADIVRSLGSRQDEDSIARHLYSILREFDDEKVTRIYSECFEATGLGQAIMNRLLKAAGHKLIVLDGNRKP